VIPGQNVAADSPTVAVTAPKADGVEPLITIVRRKRPSKLVNPELYQEGGPTMYI
jgi:hypothetical protein